MLHVLTLLHCQILMTTKMPFNSPWFFLRCRSVRWKFAPNPYMVFLRESSIGTCQNLGGCVAFPRKPPRIMPWHCFGRPDIMFACTDIVRPNFSSILVEACMATNIFSLLQLNTGCQWTIPVSPNFWRLHSKRYCQEKNRATNDAFKVFLTSF